MSETNLRDEIAHLMVNTARAHHEATGGVNPEWAKWYAERLVDDLNDSLGSDLSQDDLERWLTDADRRYREESPSESWPKTYADWLIAEQEPTG